MSRIDPNNVVVMVRDNSDAIVRIGVSTWKEIREAVRTDQADDKKRFKEIEVQVAKATQSGISSS